MRKITEILRLKHEAKLSHEKIALALGVSKGVVSKYVSLAQAKNLSWPLPESMDEAALERFLFPAPPAPTRFVEPDLPRIHHELKRKGVTLQLLWAEYAATHGEAGYRYSQFCHRYRPHGKRGQVSPCSNSTDDAPSVAEALQETSTGKTGSGLAF